MKPNFSGWATRYGVLCSDGSTLVADAFEHQDKVKLPLVWRHNDSIPQNILGHVTLTHESGKGVRANGFFNQSEGGKSAKAMVEHGDLNSLSIRAIRLKRNGGEVLHGDLSEVSLVLNGANPEARIDSVYIQHDDGMTYEQEDEAIIRMGDTLSHEDDKEDKDKGTDSSEEGSGRTVQEIYDSLDEDQKEVVDLLVSTALGDSDEEGKKDDEESEDIKHKGDRDMARNVFEGEETPTDNQLSHEDVEQIFRDAQRSGSLKETVLEHADKYGITNIEELFPEANKVRTTPDWIKRDDSWVAGIMGGVARTPFSRIKSMSADVTHEDARAKGYITGNMKKDEYYAVAKRITTPTTIYKKQKLDRDDIIDVTDFDVVAWMKGEMRWMLQEEIARVILFGDGRDPGSEDKVNENNIRPIATDDDFYTTKKYLTEGESVKGMMRKILRSRKDFKGTGRPVLYTTDDFVIDCLLLEDKLGRRYYETEESLAAALGVKGIVTVEVLEEGYTDDNENELMGVMVNINDYTLGADKGGEVSMFDDFDIDYNQYKYLIETRFSGALTRRKSAVSLWLTKATRVTPDEPVRTDTNTVTVPDTPGVLYYHQTVGNDDVEVTDSDVTITEENSPYTIVAKADEGFRLASNVTTQWTFEHQE